MVTVAWPHPSTRWLSVIVYKFFCVLGSRPATARICPERGSQKEAGPATALHDDTRMLRLQIQMYV